MRFERAGGTHGSAGSAPDAPLGFDDQLVVVVGDATARAHIGALHARCVAIAHNSATALMNRNVGALKLFEQTEEIRHVSHDFTLSRLPPCTAQYNHFRRLTREKTRLTPSASLPYHVALGSPPARRSRAKRTLFAKVGTSGVRFRGAVRRKCKQCLTRGGT